MRLWSSMQSGGYRMSKTEQEMIADMYKMEPPYLIDDNGNKTPLTLKQIDGNHYSKHKIQPWDIIDEWELDYYLGNVIKYVLRDKDNQVIDLKKAIHYLEKKIELLEKE